MKKGGGEETYRVDLRNSILWMLARLEKLLEHRLRTRVAVVKKDVQENQGVDMPGCKDLPHLRASIWLAFLAALALHALLCEFHFLFCQVKGLGDFGEVGQEEEAHESNGDGDDAVDDEEPLPPSETAFAVESVDAGHEVA